MRLSDKRVSQRGVTLVELVVALTILSIITTLIVSFTVSMRNLTNRNNEMYNEMESLTFSREFIENWFHSFDEESNVFNINNEGMLVITSNSVEYSINITEQDVVILEYPNEKDKSYLFEGIDKIAFENVESENNVSTRLYKCTISYGEESKFSFVLGRRS